MYKRGDIVNLGGVVGFRQVGFEKKYQKRLAVVVKVFKRFVRCKAINGGYHECINIQNMGGGTWV